MANITRFPTNNTTRRKNGLGKLAVPCQVTDRFLDIVGKSSNVGGEEFITIDVRTGGYSGREGARKITQLIVTRKDLTMALGNVKVSKD